MGQFSVPGVMISKVLSGATRRVREHQESARADEQSRRDKYVAHLGRLLDMADDDETVDQINEQIAKAIETPLEKPFKPQAIKPPSRFMPGASGAPGSGATPVTLGGKAMGGGVSAGAGAGATPQFDFRQLLNTITGRDQGPADLAPPDMSAIPSGMTPGGSAPSPTAGAGPFTGATPQLVPPMGTMGMTGGLPAAATPAPDRALPETPPMLGMMGGGGPAPGPVSKGDMSAATPPPVAVGGEPATPSPVTADPTQRRWATPSARAELPYILNEKYGMTKTGRALGGNSKPALTVSDLNTAARNGYDIVEVPKSPEYPLGFALVPRARSELSLFGQSKIDTEAAKRASLKANAARADKLLSLKRELASISAAARSSKDAKTASRSSASLTLRAATAYSTLIKPFEEAQDNYHKLEAVLSQATGPADYQAILLAVHQIDDTAAREGEVKLFRNAASWDTRLSQALGRLTTGELLEPDNRQAILEAAAALNSAVQQRRAAVDEQYAAIASDAGLNPIAVGLGRSPDRDSSVTPPTSRAGAGTGTRQSKEQVHPRTGARRTVYSDDGGRTWHP